MRRRFRDALGLGPGRLRRIARFARTWRRVAAAPPAQGWAALATDAGYSDQAHRIRNFRPLAGASPARLFGEAWYRTPAFEAAPGPMSLSFNPAGAASR